MEKDDGVFADVDYDEVMAVTENAIKLDIDGDSIWVPISQIRNAQEIIEDHPWTSAGIAEITEWWAIRSGLA